MRGRTPRFVPCTPKGCIELLKRAGVKMAGKKAAVVGRSNIVGMPAALLLQREDATVTVIHSRTPDAAAICAEADIIIAACGKAEMVRGDWVKPGAAVIDVGINAVDVSAGGGGAGSWEWVPGAGRVPRAARGAASLLPPGECRGDALACPWPAPLACRWPELLRCAAVVQDPSAKRGYRLVGDVHYGEASAKAGFITPVPGGVGPMTIAMLCRNTVDGFKQSLA